MITVMSAQIPPQLNPDTPEQRTLDYPLVQLSPEDPNHELAYGDELTGLLNRRWLTETLTGLSENEPGNFSLLMVDVDGLKKVNDEHGHVAGDQLIKKTASVLSGSYRTERQNMTPDRRAGGDETDQLSHIAVRLSGDEFIVLLRGVKTTEQLQPIKERIQTNLQDAGIQASIGGRPHQDGESGTELLGSVDELMYAQKRDRYKRRFEDLPRRKRVANRIGSMLLDYSGIKPVR